MNDQQQQIFDASVKTVHAADRYLRSWKRTLEAQVTGEDATCQLEKTQQCLVELERATSQALALLQ